MAKNCIERMEEIDGKRRVADFQAKQKQDYPFKRTYAYKRAHEFVDECSRRGLNYHVSVGGLDSIVLYIFLHSIGIDCSGISVSYLEDKSIQNVHKALGIERLKSSKKPDGTRWKQVEVIQKFGFPVLSKEIAGKIHTLANPTPKNATVRHAIITGETGEYGGNRKDTRMKMSQKWLEKFAGYENENEGVNYQIAPFDVSDECCYRLKEKPCDDWAKEHNSVPFLGLMASEGGRREKALMLNGCNYFGKSTIRSAPFAIFMRNDILCLAVEMNDYYHEHWQEFGTTHLNTIVPEIYGEIATREDGTLYTTKAQRTGCPICGFGIHLDKRPHHFDMMYQDNAKAWDFYMNRCVTDKQTGELYGWGRVLDYIGVHWTPETLEADVAVQRAKELKKRQAAERRQMLQDFKNRQLSF